VGSRTYHYRDLKSAASQTNFLGYGAIGLDVVSKALRGSTRRRSDGASRVEGLGGESSPAVGGGASGGRQEDGHPVALARRSRLAYRCGFASIVRSWIEQTFDNVS
jgi:hypothetical protein